MKGEISLILPKKRKPTAALKVGVVLTIPAAGSESSTSTVIEKQ